MIKKAKLMHKSVILWNSRSSNMLCNEDDFPLCCPKLAVGVAAVFEVLLYFMYITDSLFPVILTIPYILGKFGNSVFD